MNVSGVKKERGSTRKACSKCFLSGGRFPLAACAQTSQHILSIHALGRRWVYTQYPGTEYPYLSIWAVYIWYMEYYPGHNTQYTCRTHAVSRHRAYIQYTHTIHASSIHALNIYTVYTHWARMQSWVHSSNDPALCIGVSRPLQSAGHWGLWVLGSPPYHSLTLLPITYPPPVRGVITTDTKWFFNGCGHQEWPDGRVDTPLFEVHWEEGQLRKHSKSSVSLENVRCLLSAQGGAQPCLTGRHWNGEWYHNYYYHEY